MKSAGLSPPMVFLGMLAASLKARPFTCGRDISRPYIFTSNPTLNHIHAAVAAAVAGQEPPQQANSKLVGEPGVSCILTWSHTPYTYNNCHFSS
jgi:hypothetical protein